MNENQQKLFICECETTKKRVSFRLQLQTENNDKENNE